MKIEKIKIYSSDIERQYQLYCEQLMFSCVEKNDQFFCIKAGNSILQIQKSPEHVNAYYHIAFNIEPSLFLEAVNYLQQKNMTILTNENSILIDFPDWNARSVYFLDAAGNIMEFIARFNLPHHQHKRPFNMGDILSISEIGVPVNDPVEFLNILQKNTPVAVWKSYGESFIAAGDEEGLLIIVAEKRNWFPTNFEAEQLPAEILIQQQGNDFEYGKLHFLFSA